ncbi:MAG: aminopeptidase, partial [Bacteroidota bacterium]
MQIFDPHSAAQSNARVTHLNWKAKIDVELEMIFATAQYTISVKSGAEEILLDTKNLNINEVKVDGKKVKFSMGENKPFLGSALHIPIQEDS